MEKSKKEKGQEILETLTPGGAARLEKGLKDIAPDLSQYVLEFVFGTMYDRPGLDLQTKQLLTITILGALGNARPQLEYHIKCARQLGIPKETIIDTLLHLAPYAGFPAAMNAVGAAKTAFEEAEKTS